MHGEMALWASTWVGLTALQSLLTRNIPGQCSPGGVSMGLGRVQEAAAWMSSTALVTSVGVLAILREIRLLSEQCGLWWRKTWVRFHHLCDLPVGPWESPLSPGASASLCIK